MKRVRIAALLVYLGCTAAAFALGDGKVHVYFVDVGQGDATLVIGPQGTSVLIDGGPSDTVTPMVEAMNDAIAAGLTDNTLDYVVCSHFHQDHLEGLEGVAQAFPGGVIAAYDRGGARSIVAFTEYDNYFGASGLNKRRLAETFSIGTDCTMTYVGHPTAGESDENNNGVLYRLDFRNFQVSFGGDLGGTYEVNFASAFGDVEHYKANHHGSASSSQQAFLDVILPQTHSFSYGVGNSYGHPTSSAITRCAGVGSVRFDTPLNHSANGPYIELDTDGYTQYTVNGTAYNIPGGQPPPPATTVFINEALPAPSSGSEWVELYNTGTTTVDLAGWQLDDLIGGGSAPVTLSGSIAPGGFFVYTYSTAVLNNTGDDINLLNASGQVVNSTTYGSAPSGQSWARSVDGTGSFAWDATPSQGASNNGTLPPAAPSGLSATAASSSQINLSWQDNSGNETNFVVARSTSAGGPYGDIITLGANSTSHSDTGLSASTTYYYVVRATNAAGSSANSNEASATTQPPPVAVKINEAMPAPSSNGEWVELYNAGSTSVDLTGWQIDDIIGGGSAPVTLTGSIAPGGFFVYNYSTSVLNNTGDDINLINGSGQVVDSTTYGSAPSDNSWARGTDGTGTFAWDATPTKGSSNSFTGTLVHVNSITMSWVKSGGKWKARAVVNVRNASGANVQGATVTGNFTGAINESNKTGTTDGSGNATITTSGSISSGTVTFTVTNITGTNLVYDSGANIETSDSISR